MKPKKLCVICKEEYSGYGHNAEPLRVGRCCNKCNFSVIMERIKQIPEIPEKIEMEVIK